MLAKRQEDIYRLLEIQGSAKVAELSEKFGVTEKTIRQDLARLEETKFVRRTHGGAVLLGSDNSFFNMMTKKQINIEEKRRIAAAAYEIINDGDSLFLDAGTTTFELAKILDKSVMVITNDPHIANQLNYKDKVLLYMTGGRLKRESASLTYVGTEAVRMIRNYNIHKMFLAASAFTFEQGYMVFSAEEMEIKSAAMSVSKYRYALIDYSKFNTTALGAFASVDDVNMIITDDRITSADKQKAQELGLTLKVV